MLILGITLGMLVLAHTLPKVVSYLATDSRRYS